MPFSYVNGVLKLKADDGNWYFVKAFIEDDIKTIDIDQTPTSAPVGYNEYAVIESSDLQNYKFSLISITENSETFIDLNIDQTPTGEDASDPPPVLKGNDGNWYELNLVTISGDITYEIGNTTSDPGGEIEIPPISVTIRIIGSFQGGIIRALGQTVNSRTRDDDSKEGVFYVNR